MELVVFADAGTRVSTRIQVIGFRKFKAVEREGKTGCHCAGT